MPKGVYKTVIARLRKKVGRRPKGNGKWRTDKHAGVVYLPKRFIGKQITIEVLDYYRKQA